VTTDPAANFWRLVGAQEPIDRVTTLRNLAGACGDGRQTYVLTLDMEMRLTGICPRTG
jgi:hypothetical protein